MKKIIYFGFVFAFIFPLSVNAVSFTADAVQTKNGEFNHARMLWTDDRVRFEYLDQGVAMAQIYDSVNKKVIWLDTENKVFLERTLSNEQAKQNLVGKSKVVKNPCELIDQAQCTRLKDVAINGRDTVKWLITLDLHGNDQHVFQWLDKKYGVVIKQLNPDGSFINSNIEEDQEVNGRKTRKIDTHAITENGVSMRSLQWYDNDLDVVIRQVLPDGAMDELRNIKVEKIAGSLFKIPEGYTEIDQTLMTSQPAAIKYIETQNN